MNNYCLSIKSKKKTERRNTRLPWLPGGLPGLFPLPLTGSSIMSCFQHLPVLVFFSHVSVSPLRTDPLTGHLLSCLCVALPSLYLHLGKGLSPKLQLQARCLHLALLLLLKLSRPQNLASSSLYQDSICSTQPQQAALPHRTIFCHHQASNEMIFA
jgi:hypothetical protein